MGPRLFVVIQTRYPFRDKAKDETLKGTLRRKLFTLAGMGIRDDEALAVLLNSIPYSYGVAPPAQGNFASLWRNRRI